jgi:molybdopterin-guanine dinucleotide biosynthesis protein A
LARIIAMRGVVLAGGRSRRFGRDKRLALIEGERLVDRQVRTLRAFFPDVMVVGGAAEEPSDRTVPVVHDIVPASGPLGGIHAALSHARDEDVLVTACDMPFLQLPLLRRLVEVAPGQDVVVCRRGSYLEPLPGVYSSRCLPHISRMLDLGERRIIGFFPFVKTVYLDEEETRRFDPLGLSFFNVNTPEDMVRANELLRGSR